MEKINDYSKKKFHFYINTILENRLFDKDKGLTFNIWQIKNIYIDFDIC